MRFAFIHDHQGEFPVDLLCDVLKVSKRILRLEGTASRRAGRATRGTPRADP